MSASFDRYLSVAVLTVWGGMLSYFVLSGRLASYLHPSFHLLTALSAVILLLLAGGLLFVPGVEELCCEPNCEHAHSRKSPRRSILAAVVLVVPLSAASIASPDQYGAAMVVNRGLIEETNKLPGYIPNAAPRLRDLPDGQAPTVSGNADESYLKINQAGQIETETVDLIFAAEEPSMRADFEGKQINAIGQFMPARDNNPKVVRFNLVRMFMMCCAADARPMAVAVQTDQPPGVPEMSWVSVVGKASFPVESGRNVPLILAETVTVCDPPEETLIY